MVRAARLGLRVFESGEYPLRAVADNRLIWLDAAKGIAITLVVIGHAWRGLHSSGLIADGLFQAVDGRIYAFHMPVFFLMSGLFYVGTVTRHAFPAYAWRLAVRLVWPMVLWTYVFLAMKYAAGTMSNSPISLSEVFQLPFPGVAHFWFLWALLLMSLALWPIRFFVQGGRVTSLGLILFAVIVAGFYLTPLPPGVHHWIGNAALHAPFFYLGLCLVQQNVLARLQPMQGGIAAVIFAALLWVWPMIAPGAFQTITVFALTIAFIVVSATLLASLPQGVLSVLARLGQASLAIYVAHTIFSAAFREVLFVIGIDNAVLHMAGGTAIGLIGPLVLLALARATRTQKLLGIG